MSTVVLVGGYPWAIAVQGVSSSCPGLYPIHSFVKNVPPKGNMGCFDGNVARIPSGPASKVLTYQRFGTCATFVIHTANRSCLDQKALLAPHSQSSDRFVSAARGQTALAAIDNVVCGARQVCRRSPSAKTALISYLSGQPRNTPFSSSVALTCLCRGRDGCNRHRTFMHLTLLDSTTSSTVSLLFR